VIVNTVERAAVACVVLFAAGRLATVGRSSAPPAPPERSAGGIRGSGAPPLPPVSSMSMSSLDSLVFVGASAIFLRYEWIPWSTPGCREVRKWTCGCNWENRWNQNILLFPGRSWWCLWFLLQLAAYPAGLAIPIALVVSLVFFFALSIH
jgi:hypothetical protein